MSVYDDFEPNGNGNGAGDLDEDFPLGDGTVDTEATVVCPYCAEESLSLSTPEWTGPGVHRGLSGVLSALTVVVSYHDGMADVAVRALE